MVITQWQLYLEKSPLVSREPMREGFERTQGQPQQDSLLVAPLITCADEDALTRSFCALIGPRGQMRSFIGPRLIQGSEKEVVIKTESRSIFLLPGRPQPAFCWAVSAVFIAWFLLFVSPFFFALSASVSFSPSSLSFPSLIPSDPELICLFKSLPVLLARRRCPFPSPFPLFPTAAFRKLSCVKWDRADWLPVLVRARETVKRL